MADAAKQGGEGPKKKPGWMSIPGGPKEPNFNDFFQKLQALNAKKSALFDRLKEIREEFEAGNKEEDAEIRDERNKLNARMKEIEAERKKAKALQEEKHSERQSIAQQRIALKKQVEELTADLGIFKSLDDIEEAIDRVLIHMETGSGTLSSEKKTLKRVNQLEKAKGLLLQLRPMQERIAEAEAEERALREEHEEVYARIKSLDKQFAQTAAQKSATNAAVKEQQKDRQKLQAERTAIREKLSAVNDEITALRKKYDDDRKAWGEWREKAQAIWKEQREAAQREYEKKKAEREARIKAERKAARAAKKLNPYANEIDACSGLIRYLEEKVNAHKRDKEKIEHEKKLAAFNAKESAPKGFAVRVEDDDWAFQDRTRQQKQKAKAPTPQEKKEDDKDKNREKMITHSMERLRSFELVGVERPLTLAKIPEVVEILKKKRAEFQAHIKDDASSSSSEDEEEAEAEEEPAAEGEAPAEVEATA